jgi:hypothetical protein
MPGVNHGGRVSYFMTMEKHANDRLRSSRRAAARRMLALAVLAGLALASCGEAPLPPRLAGLRRGRVISGLRAVRMIAQLHGDRVVPPAAMIADYGSRGQLRVWLARYRDAGEAERVLSLMVARLGSQGSPFSRPFEAPGLPRRWFTTGLGGHHLFWAAGASIYWVAGEPDLLEAAASELPQPARGNWT